MGWYPTTYIGPYVEVTVKRVWKVRSRCKDDATFCPSKSLEVGAFCSKCGQQAPIFDKVFRPKFGPWDVVEEINEALTHEATDDEGCDTDPEVKFRFVPNQYREGVNTIRRRGQECRAYDLSETLRGAEIGIFAEAFAEEIKAVREYYGNATVKWGVIFSGN
jgi:hypothetical protein